MTDSVTARQRQLMRQLIDELRDCEAFGAETLERKMVATVSRMEASELIAKAVSMLREYNHNAGTIC